ncbi:DUF202 domain-containing protein [Candidatus Bipolaricaulota bacterium]|nr:DUF202 domain-containing protein [Candidatus Bipolaricaulota bacterium]
MSAPYDDISGEDLMLRDRLAAERTVLAAERTFLAYVRTALALVAAGGSFVYFLQSPWLTALGWALVAAAAATLVVGSWRFSVARSRIARLTALPPEERP